MHFVSGGPSPEEVHPNEVSDVARPRPFRDLLRTTGLGDPAVLQDDETLGQRDRFHRVVRHEEADAVVAVELAAQLTARLQTRARVEGGQRFVEQEQARLRREGPDQGDPLRLAAGQLVRLAPPVFAEPHPIEPLGGPGPGFAFRHATAAQPEGHVLEGGEVREEEVVLEDDPHRAGFGRDVLAGCRVVEDPPVEHHPPLVGGHEPGQDAQECGLPRAIGPEEPDDPPGRHVEFHVEFERAEPDPHLGAQAPLPHAQLKTPPATGPGDRRERPATRAAAPS